MYHMMSGSGEYYEEKWSKVKEEQDSGHMAMVTVDRAVGISAKATYEQGPEWRE